MACCAAVGTGAGVGAGVTCTHPEDAGAGAVGGQSARILIPFAVLPRLTISATPLARDATRSPSLPFRKRGAARGGGGCQRPPCSQRRRGRACGESRRGAGGDRRDRPPPPAQPPVELPFCLQLHLRRTRGGAGTRGFMETAVPRAYEHACSGGRQGGGNDRAYAKEVELDTRRRRLSEQCPKLLFVAKFARLPTLGNTAIQMTLGRPLSVRATDLAAGPQTRQA